MSEARRIHIANATSAHPRSALSIPGWGAISGGSTLALVGLTRRSKAGWALAAGGGLLAYAGTRAAIRRAPLIATSTMQVNCSPEEAYRFWRNFENLPLFMRHLDSVSILGDRR